MLLKILTVAGLATFEIYAAIPTGFALGLTPWLIFFSSAAGGLTGVFIAVFLGDKINAFIGRYRKAANNENNTNTFAHRIWKRFGIIGLGFFGTVIVGAPISIAVGVGFKAPLHQLTVWCCAGVITRCMVLTLAGHYGLKLF